VSQFRRDPVSGQWVIIAPERCARPSDFPVEPRVSLGGFCPFCEGNESRTPPEVDAVRPEGAPSDGPGWQVRVVPNRFPALTADMALASGGDALGETMSGFGIHEVIIECPEHILSMADMPSQAIRDVFAAYGRRLAMLRQDKRLAYAMIFKNVGAAAGASLEHCHSQLIALPAVPRNVRDELHGARRYMEKEGECVFCAIMARERGLGERIVHEGEHYCVIAPYASRFPFETWILPKNHCPAFELQPQADLNELGSIVGKVLRGLDKALDCPAYNYIMHTEPFRSDAGTPSAEVMAKAYHWHIEIIPRVTRLAGFEWGTGFYINPVAPEVAAACLRREAFDYHEEADR
jgi:UDPglucose--hexose-1-phosphate uridylyltransferase